MITPRAWAAITRHEFGAQGDSMAVSLHRTEADAFREVRNDYGDLLGRHVLDEEKFDDLHDAVIKLGRTSYSWRISPVELPEGCIWAE